jgi:hypothetical protein
MIRISAQSAAHLITAARRLKPLKLLLRYSSGLDDPKGEISESSVSLAALFTARERNAIM